MDTNGNDHLEQEKRNEDLLSYTSPNLSSDWRFNDSNLTNTSLTNVNPVAVYKGIPMEASSSSSHPMVDSFCPTIWDHPMNTSNFGFCDINNLHNASMNSNGMGIRSIDMGWAPLSSMVKGNMLLPSGSGLFPQGLSQFPADSSFIERAARFSSFGRGNFSDLINPYGVLEGVNPYIRATNTMMMQRPQGLLVGNDIKSVSAEKFPKDDVNVGDDSKNVSLSAEQSERSPPKNEGKCNSFGNHRDKEKQGCVVSGNESDDAEFSGGEPSSSKALGSKKRKRDDQGYKHGQNEDVPKPPGDITKDNTEGEPKVDQTPTSTSKANGKQSKQGSRASDSPKEEYIHVRARRGQATNSHSLAERVRREKISERMKFLQDLVPGCSKVTGKAVMLDEIINYVQSLQRQVEFLSMKLATVNPRLHCNLEDILAKDMSRAGPSSSLRYSPDMSTIPFPLPHPSQPGFIQPCLPSVAASSDALQISMSNQLAAMSEGYKQPGQVPNMWVEDELHNVVQMGLNSSTPLDNAQDLNGSSSQSHTKVEL